MSESHGFRFIGHKLEEFLNGVPSRDIPPEHFDQLEPDAQQTLLEHVEHAPTPIFEQDDSVTAPEPQAAEAEQPAPEPQPTPATNEPQQVVEQPAQPEQPQPEQPAPA